MKNAFSPTPACYFYSGVFAVSGTLMGLQILQSRIFSVTTWYHLAFLVISVAMFGLTLAALDILRGDERKQRAEAPALMAAAARRFGLYILLALAAQLLIPIVYGSLAGTLVTLPLVSLFTVLPYYQAGIILSLALTRTSYPVGRTYGIDLTGAAAGCLFALLLMRFLDAPSAVIALAVLALAASHIFRRAEGKGTPGRSFMKRIDVLPLALLLIVALNAGLAKPLIYPLWVKTIPVIESGLAYDHWNSISRVTVDKERKDVPPFLWGASPALPADLKTSYYYLKIDGDAGTPINQYDGKNRASVAFLEYDVTTVAYSLPGLGRAAIIGVGGGRDALTAHYFGVRDITAMDVNDNQISLLTRKEPFRSYAGLADIPGIKLIHSEARSWFAHNRETFDIIQMSLIDTWAATGAGAFALSENGLYTVEAFKTFLSDLNDHGVLTVSRWYTPEAQNETQRLLAMAAQALFEMGAAEPARHIFVAQAGRIATLVLSRNPFSEDQIKALRLQAEKRQFSVLADPDSPGAFDAVTRAESPAALLALAKDNSFDISPPHDTRPFFFNQVRLTRPMQVFEIISGDSVGAAMGHAKATLNLYVIICFAAMMVGFVILYPLRHALKDVGRPYAFAGTAWFFLIGLGFMFLEIALVQRMSIYLGHPVYSLGIVLFSIVLSTGAGSLLSGRYPLQSFAQRAGWALAVAGAAMVIPWIMSAAFHLFAEAGLPVRAFLCVALIAPAGVLLGYGFPTGMGMVQAIDTRPAPWFWGINGAAGVMGSALAVACNIAFGLNWTIMAGGVCYALLALPAAGLGRLAAKGN